MCGTRAAGGDERLLQCLPSAVDSHGRVGQRDVVCGGERVQGGFVQVDLAENPGVAGIERGQHSGDAFADDVAGQVIGFNSGFEFRGPLGKGAILDAAVPIEVDDCVAQDAVEPCRSGLAVAKFAFAFERAKVGVLEDVFGDSWRSDAPLEEAQELAPLVEQRVEEVRLR